MNAADSLPDAPVFEEPWQAHAFAMTVSLHERGVFTWSEWSHTLSREISRGGESYYLHWLRALEALVTAKGVASNDELTRLQRRGATPQSARTQQDTVVVERRG